MIAKKTCLKSYVNIFETFLIFDDKTYKKVDLTLK